MDLPVFPILIPPPTSLSTQYHLFSGLVPEGLIKLYMIVQLYIKQIASAACCTAQGAQRGTCGDLEGCGAGAEGEREGVYAHAWVIWLMHQRTNRTL